MTFEEFFNKKRIDLVALRAAEPGLFAEFEKHFTQMGEKSFDHTKKYWFNKLRLQYHLAPALKPEKIHQENQLAEQTIVETLTDSTAAPSTGFKPKFKPGIVSKPAEPVAGQNDAPAIEQPATPQTGASAEVTAPKPGFKPRFNAKMVTPKPAEAAESKSEQEPAAETTPSEGSAPKPGFKPRFNMKMAAPKPAETEDAKPETEPAAEPAQSETVAPKPGFKPRFNMKTMAAKPTEAAEEKVELTATGDKPAAMAETPAPAEKTTAPKPGFKPRFNMKAMVPKPAEAPEGEKVVPEQAAAEDKPADVIEPTPPAETPAAPKVGFKPRFNAKTTKPQQPEE
ncbi:hypothetical protein IDJ75_19505 [Mucilaginibacter rigui]|uniref:Uncharacterized protein n=1 Tax=Mucilaginibacter rigui TaxID=534635 RepID=A0ABR7XCY3_9SPHI|nr:hypothetical protein [Mucilaginibacter rigui]MBD1387480.1 hypothetical protein [Mucilaginibacter rigui]